MPWIKGSKYGFILDPNKSYNCRIHKGKLEVKECGCPCHKPYETVIHFVTCCSRPTPDGHIYLERDPMMLRFQWD
jgi:hypothetical protein